MCPVKAEKLPVALQTACGQALQQVGTRSALLCPCRGAGGPQNHVGHAGPWTEPNVQAQRTRLVQPTRKAVYFPPSWGQAASSKRSTRVECRVPRCDTAGRRTFRTHRVRDGTGFLARRRGRKGASPDAAGTVISRFQTRDGGKYTARPVGLSQSPSRRRRKTRGGAEQQTPRTGATAGTVRTRGHTEPTLPRWDWSTLPRRAPVFMESGWLRGQERDGGGEAEERPALLEAAECAAAVCCCPGDGGRGKGRAAREDTESNQSGLSA